MRGFFSRFKGSSSIAAKNRLKSVISNDRISMSQDVTMEKIRKDVAQVLMKYTGENSQSVKVWITDASPSQYNLSATVLFDTALQ